MSICAKMALENRKETPMTKTQKSIIALSVLVALASTASAGVNPQQNGDVGGKNAAALEAQLREKNNMPANGSQGGGAVITEVVDYYFDGVDTADSATVNYYFDGVDTANDGTVDYYYGGVHGSVDGNLIPGMDLDPAFAVPTQPAPIPGVVQGNPIIIPQQPAGNAPVGTSGSAAALDWFKDGGAELLKQNPNITVYDVNAGKSWSAKYINGANHADIIPASKADADTAKSLKGDRRPVKVTINGVQYAGSLYAVGHGSTSYCNYFKGVMCIHFSGSKTHGSKKVDKDHQKNITNILGSN